MTRRLDSGDFDAAAQRAFDILRASDSRDALAEGIGTTTADLDRWMTTIIGRWYRDPSVVVDRQIAAMSHAEVFRMALVAGRHLDIQQPDLVAAVEAAIDYMAGKDISSPVSPSSAAIAWAR